MNYKEIFNRSIYLCTTCKVRYNCLELLIIVRKIVNNQQFVKVNKGPSKQLKHLILCSFSV